MTSDFADQLNEVHDKLSGVSSQLDGALATMLGLSAELQDHLATVLDPVNTAMIRLENYFGLNVMTMLRYRNGLCLAILWNTVFARITDLPVMQMKFVVLYVLADSTIGRVLAFWKLESALFLAAIIWHLYTNL